MSWIAAYLATGAAVGFVAGLLGIGGGMTLVPILSAMYGVQQLAPEHSVHLALGTGMASVVFTSTASVREHHRHRAVDWGVVGRFTPAMVAGTLLSTVASGWVSQRALALAFALIVFAGATQILLGRKPSAGRALPGNAGLLLVGLLIGIVCGLVSAGGAFLTVPFMLFCGITMHVAIGTGAAIGVPVAIVGTIGFVISGLQVPGLPSYSLGFIYLPALVALVLASVLTAPYGARAAHRLPVQTLKRFFAVLLYLLAIRMVISYW